MKLLEIHNSRLAVLVRLTRPEGQTYLPSLLSAIVERYGFVERPSIEQILSRPGEGALFKQGQFRNTAFDIVAYDDGLILESRSNSRILEVIYSDLRSWMFDEFGLEEVEYTKANRNYESAVVVETSSDVVRRFSDFQYLSRQISERLRDTNGVTAKYEFFGFNLSIDPLLFTGVKPAVFRFERKVGSEYSFNHFFSVAPLQTDDHMSLLQDFASSTQS